MRFVGSSDPIKFREVYMEIDITEIDSIGIHADWLSERLNQHVNRIEKNVEHIKEQVLKALILN